MSCRVLGRGEAAAARPMIWPPARRAPEPEPVKPPVPVPAPPPAPVVQALSEAEVEARERRAFDEGFRQGQAAARQESGACAAEVLDRLSRAASEIAVFKPRLRREAEEDVVKLAMAIARRIVYRELSVDPEALAGIARAALDRLDRREVKRLRMNPQDAALAGSVSGVEVVPDASLPRGSAVFETDRGAEDWSVETQLAEIQRGLMDRLGRGR